MGSTYEICYAQIEKHFILGERIWAFLDYAIIKTENKYYERLMLDAVKAFYY